MNDVDNSTVITAFYFSCNAERMYLWSYRWSILLDSWTKCGYAFRTYFHLESEKRET